MHPQLTADLKKLSQRMFASMISESKADSKRLALEKEIKTLEADRIPTSCKAHVLPFVSTEWV